MAWLRLDDGFTDHRKIVALKTDQRRWTWLRILTYTARYRSPVVPADIAHVVAGATPKFLADCRRIGLLDDHDDGADFIVHDWHHYQPKERSDDVDSNVATLLKERPDLSANQVARILGGSRKAVLDAFKRYHGGTDAGTGSTTGTGTGTGYARARPVPSPTPVPLDPAAAATTTDGEPTPEPAAEDAAAALVIDHIDDLGLNGSALDLARADPGRAAAWLDLAQTEAKTNPAAFVLAGLHSNEWPTKRIGAAAPSRTPYQRAETLIRNVGKTLDKHDLERELDDLGVTDDQRVRLRHLHQQVNASP